MDLTVVHEEGKDVAPGQAKTGLGMLVEKEQWSKKYHDNRRKMLTETTQDKPVESDEERQDTLQSEVVLQEQDDTIKDLIARAQGYRVQLKDKDRKILKAKETVDSLRKQLDFMREEKKRFDREMIAEKQRYLDLYDSEMIVERRLKNEIVEKDALLEKLKEEIKNLKMENAELTTLTGEMGDVKADNIHLSNQIEHLNSVVHELSREGRQNMGGIVHKAVPLNTIQQTYDFEEMPATRERGRAEKKVVDDNYQKTTVYKRKRKDVPPSSLTKRVKGRHSQMVEEKDGTEKLINLLNSRLWGLLEPGIHAILVSLQMYSNRSTPFWESGDSLGKQNLNAGMIEDLYIGSWLSSDLVDW